MSNNKISYIIGSNITQVTSFFSLGRDFELYLGVLCLSLRFKPRRKESQGRSHFDLKLRICFGVEEEEELPDMYPMSP